MAGAGKKTFVAGEVLTAAQVNDYLMDQAVMRFSGSAARAASITAPTEGMVTYLDDSNVLEYYDGSAWLPVYPSSDVAASLDGKIAASLITASAQVLVGAGSASVIAVGGGAEGQVLTAASAQPGGVTWATPSGGGTAVYKLLAATGVTDLGVTLTPGFYRIQLSTTESFTTAQWGFLDSESNKYGFAITSGTGTGTIPVYSGSVELTKGSFPITVLIEEIPGVTGILPTAATVSDIEWTTISDASFNAVTSPVAASIGTYLPSGALLNLGPTSASVVPLVSSSITDANLNQSFDFRLVEITSDNLVGIAASATASGYPFAVYTSASTYVPPPWSASAEVLVVSGGGGGGNTVNPSPGIRGGGGGGAGGASVFALATPSPVSITIAAGGTAGTPAAKAGDGGITSFGALSTAGGGGGGTSGPTNKDGNPGGSGGGGSYHHAFPAGGGGTGIAGQGNDGSPGAVSGRGGGGGGFSASGGATGGAGGTQWGYTFSTGGTPLTAGSGAGPNGADNTGNGGGGAVSSPSSNYSGGTGGSGIVIVKALA